MGNGLFSMVFKIHKIKGGDRGIITKKGVVHMNQKILMWIALALILLQGKLEYMWM